MDDDDRSLDDDEDALFRASMKRLSVVPDTDEEPRRRPPDRRPAPRRRAAPRARLDLHGRTVEEALRALRAFVFAATAQRLGTVLVVTGKGLHSAGGEGVVKRAVERWLRQESGPWVRAYAEAPPALGGRGAFLLHLR